MKHVWWWYLFPWIGLARMTEAYENALVIVREQSMELHKLRLETAGLWRMARKLGPRVAPEEGR